MILMVMLLKNLPSDLPRGIIDIPNEENGRLIHSEGVNILNTVLRKHVTHRNGPVVNRKLQNQMRCLKMQNTDSKNSKGVITTMKASGRREGQGIGVYGQEGRKQSVKDRLVLAL
jgi:hypothetical protein